MGQTDDLLTAVAETLPNAILVGAVGFGDGNFSVPDGDGIIASVSRLEHHFRVLAQIDDLGVVDILNLRQLGRRVQRRQKGQNQTQGENRAKNQDPVFVFQRRSPLQNVTVRLTVSV